MLRHLLKAKLISNDACELNILAVNRYDSKFILERFYFHCIICNEDDLKMLFVFTEILYSVQEDESSGYNRFSWRILHKRNFLFYDQSFVLLMCSNGLRERKPAQEITGSLLSNMNRKRTSIVGRSAMAGPSHGGSRFLILETASESKYEYACHFFHFYIHIMRKTKLVKIMSGRNKQIIAVSDNHNEERKSKRTNKTTTEWFILVHRHDELLQRNFCIIWSYIIGNECVPKAYLPATGTPLNKKKEAPGGGPVIALRQR